MTPSPVSNVTVERHIRVRAVTGPFAELFPTFAAKLDVPLELLTGSTAGALGPLVPEAILVTASRRPGQRHRRIVAFRRNVTNTPLCRQTGVLDPALGAGARSVARC